MPVDFNLDFFVDLFGVAALVVGAIGLSLLMGVVLAFRTWARCRSRERLEGSKTATAQGSRVGARLGLATGVLSVVLPPVLFSGGSLLEGLLEGVLFNRTLMILFTVILAPPAIWGMLSGAIAGQCKTRRNAALLGGFMFLFLGNPITIGFGVIAMWSALLSATGFVDLTPLLLLGSHCLFVFAVGAVIGTAAVCVGQKRAAAFAGSKHPPADLLFSKLESAGVR